MGYQVSAFLHRGFLIDTGFPRAWPELAGYLDRNRPEGAVVTHWHEDHAGNLTGLIERGVPVSVSEETVALHRALPRVPLYRWATWGHPLPGSVDPIPADHPFELIATPGHTRDHVAVWDRSTGDLFSGDLFLGVRASLAHPDESPDDILSSVRRVLALRPARVFDAHRGAIRDPEKSFRAKADWLEETIATIRRAIAAGHPDRRIVAEVLGPEPLVTRASGGQISKANFVRALRPVAAAGAIDAPRATR